MKISKRIQKRRIRRSFRVRNQVRLSGRPRLSVFRSNRHMYAQIIDDTSGSTLVSASTLEPAVAGPGKCAGNVDSASKMGKVLADRAKEKNVTEVAFDRGPYQYHGRVKAVAEAVREAGINF